MFNFQGLSMGEASLTPYAVHPANPVSAPIVRLSVKVSADARAVSGGLFKWLNWPGFFAVLTLARGLQYRARGRTVRGQGLHDDPRYLCSRPYGRGQIQP